MVGSNNKLGEILFVVLFILLASANALASANSDCFGSGCHSEPGSQFINKTLYDANSHGLLNCVDCHNASIVPTDPGHGKFPRNLNGTNITGPLFFTNYSSSNYQLCYRCHNETQLIGLPPGYSNSLWTHRPSLGFPLSIGERGTNFANELAAGYNFGNYPANLHWDHLDMIGISYDKMWASNRSGILNSMTSCTACHEPHGNTSGPVLTRDDLGITFGTDENGEYGQLTNINYLNPGGDVYCNGCHGNGTYLKYYREPKNFMDDCINCHVPSEVNTSLFARHANISTSDGIGVVSNYDCWTCHYKRDMNRSSVYLCNSCHINSSGVVNVTDPSLIITRFKHGLSTCKNCHAPDTYHSVGIVGPLGRVENPDWALVFPINGATGCLDCHSSHNGFDEPFHAPGMYRGTGGHTYAQSLCGNCHRETGVPSSEVGPHYVGGKTGSRKTVINPLDVTRSVSQGTPINVSMKACYFASSCYAFIQVELVQYRIKNTSTGGIVINWTYMNATDGKFNSYTENAFASIDSGMLAVGNYTLDVRAMSGAPRADPGKTYYPLNGLMSAISSRYVDVRTNDTIPPASITGLQNTTYEWTSINWTWVDPQDNNNDFSSVMIYINGDLQTNVSKGAQYYNATGLETDTDYTISTRTLDIWGNTNQTWLNHTARTKYLLPDSIPPESVTGLVNVSYDPDYINWTWMDSPDLDLSVIMVYINGNFQTNVSKRIQHYQAIILDSNAEYIISTRTVDRWGNTNQTWVNHTARTAYSAEGNCLSCHGVEGSSIKNNITEADVGAHTNLSSMRGAGGGDVMDNVDCKVCHLNFTTPHTSNVSKSNTYYCENCHRGASNKWNINSSIQVTKFSHGLADCAWCHSANYSTMRDIRIKNYHVGNPNGAVYSPGTWNPTSTYTGCNDCHSRYNGFDEPFHAPGYYRGSGGHTYAETLCGNCHKLTTDKASSVGSHYVIVKTATRKTSISTFTVPTNVTRGAPINISLKACYYASSCYAFIQIELAQYMLKNTTTDETVINWTYMNATDGKFNSYTENVYASIDTSSLVSGNYTLLVRAMSGAPRADPGKPYYPLNGLMSATLTRYVMVT